ncbi:MAG: hypothetical protein NC333_07190 [Terasakiella sp.]|nr:hypothetical protein [Terasakiella sp.]
MLSASADATATVFNAMGAAVHTAVMHAGEVRAIALVPGIYMVVGHKVIVR